MYVGLIIIVGVLLVATAFWLTASRSRPNSSSQTWIQPSTSHRRLRELRETTDQSIEELQSLLAIMCVADSNLNLVVGISETQREPLRGKASRSRFQPRSR
jgi:hypothetical protein